MSEKAAEKHGYVFITYGDIEGPYDDPAHMVLDARVRIEDWIYDKLGRLSDTALQTSDFSARVIESIQSSVGLKAFELGREGEYPLPLTTWVAEAAEDLLRQRKQEETRKALDSAHEALLRALEDQQHAMATRRARAEGGGLQYSHTASDELERCHDKYKQAVAAHKRWES